MAFPKWSFLMLVGSVYTIPSIEENEIGSTFIVGGSEATPHEFPWMVSLRSSLNDLHLCGGIILDTRTVLTTATCTDLLTIFYSTVAAGKHNLTADEPSQEIVQVSSIHVHPNFADTSDYSNDIAVIKVNPGFIWTPYVAPLPLEQLDKYSDSGFVIAGWGTKKEEDITIEETLQKASVEVIENNLDCQLLVGSLVTVEDSMICIKSPNPQAPVDSCNGDQGGPLLSFGNGENSAPSLVGLVSFGIGCGRPNMPSFCTRVAPYIDFIRSYLES